MRRCSIAVGIVSLTSTLLLAMSGPVAAQGPGRGDRVYFGPPPTPAQYDRFPTISGQIAYAGYDANYYNGTSLREALDQYGWFGRRYRQQNRNSDNVLTTPSDSSGGDAAATVAVLRSAVAVRRRSVDRGPGHLFAVPYANS